MQNKTCCCFGHRQIYAFPKDLLEKQIEALICQQNVTTFLTGGMRDFDCKFSTAVRKFKKVHSNIKLILIKPYFTNEINTYGKSYEQLYDALIVPDELANIHYKAAIGKRNQWMIDHSNIVLCYVHRNYGGAYQAIKYAKKQQKPVINIANQFHQ